jgi:uncharacterized protein (DUF433 family)
MSTNLLDRLVPRSGQRLPVRVVESEDVTIDQWNRLIDFVSSQHVVPKSILSAPHHAWVESSWKSLHEYLLRGTSEGSPQSESWSAVSNFGYLRRKLDASSDTIKAAVDVNLQVMHGNPVFRGTRIPVYQILEELADGTPLHAIPEGYPSLTVEQIRSGLDFAASTLRIYDE